jgi:hypothetical protein
MNSLHFLFTIFLVISSFSVTFSQTESDLANLTPEQIQTLVNNLSAEELQQMQPLCEQLFPDPTTAPQAAEQMENGQVMLGMCQAVATKLGSPTNPLSTDNPLSTQQAITPPAGAGGLSGLYKYYSSDYSLGPDGTVIPEPPVYRYFFPDGYVYQGSLGHEAVNCASTFIEGCDTYSVSGSTISFGDGQTSSLSQSGETLFIDDQEWTFVEPESFTLEGSYESSFGGSDFLSVTTLTFRDDGTFTLDGATGVVSSDTQTFGDTNATGGQSETTTTATASGGSSQNGTYVIRDNNLVLTYADGRVETLAFDYSESAEDGVYGVYVGGTLYY